MKESYLRLSHQHAAVEWIVPKDGCLLFCCFHWPTCPLDLQIALGASQVQDIALVVAIVGAGGVGGANDV
jgi:hypothetical protein